MVGSSSNGVYMLEHACYRPPEELKVVARECREDGHVTEWPNYSEAMADFMQKVFAKSGLSPYSTYLPSNIHPKHTKEPDNGIDSARLEAEMVTTGVLTDLFERTGMQPQDVDILITCCSIFCPTPSISSLIVNKFKMRQDIQTYHLGGMGCGTGVVGINLCRDLLKARPNSNLVFLPSEITSAAYYMGAEKNRMVANCIFRMGGAAVMLTNKPSLKHRCKYELVAATRVHTGADDTAYGCMSWGPDQNGINGVHLGKEVVTAAGSCIALALAQIAPQILTWRQYAQAAYCAAQRKLTGGGPEFQPDWLDCCDKFALHAGGYAVLKGLQKGLRLPTDKMLPSFAGLQEYGNTSCSTTWYSLAYMEAMQGVSKGERVMQLGVGGGMKAGVNVWRALRNVAVDHRVWQHLERPITEADLPRSVDNEGAVRDMTMAAWSSARQDEATAAVPTEAA